MSEADNSIVPEKDWKFDAKVAGQFDAHVSASVPSYMRFQQIAVELSGVFCPPDGLIVDLGAATGTTLRAILDRRTVSYLALDNSAPMAEKAKEKGITVTVTDFRRGFDLPPCDYVMSLFTLQFLPIRERKEALGKIYERLNDGGAMFIAEKVLFDNPRFQDFSNGFLFDYKRRHGIPDEEILRKERALRGNMPLVTVEHMEVLLAEAGFINTAIVIKDLHFTGWLCVKGI